MGIATGEADTSGRRLLRSGAEPGRAGDGGRPRRPDPVADSTAGLVSGLDLIDLGPRRLRDVPTPVGLFQVRGAGSARRISRRCGPSIPSPGNLRPATTSFVGRDAEVAEIADGAARTSTCHPDRGRWRRQDPACTRSRQRSCATNSQTGSGFSNWRRSAIRPPCPTRWPRCSASLSSRARRSRSRWPPRSKGRVRLLVFDNCEHVLDAAADLVDAILAQSATVRILATSREGLGVADEQVWRVRSLDVDTAVDLFVERARSVAPDFAARRARTRSRRSAVASTASRWPSSWRRRGWRR